MKTITIIAACFLITSCNSPNASIYGIPVHSKEKRFEMYAEQCQKYGHQPGTKEFTYCLEREANR